MRGINFSLIFLILLNQFMSEKVTVKTINDNTWAGVVHYRNCHADVCPYIKKNGSRYTGFNETDMKETQKKLEEILRTDLAPNSEFWDTFFIRMTDEELLLDLSDPYEELKYHFLKRHKDVKTSIFEKKAGAKYVIVDDDEEAKSKNIDAKVKRAAYTFMDKMSTEDMRDCLRLYGISSDDSNEVVESKLNEIIEADPKKFSELWIHNADKKTQVLIEKAISKNVIRRQKNRYTYGTTEMGLGIQSAIAFLNETDHQDIKLAIINQVK